MCTFFYLNMKVLTIFYLSAETKCLGKIHFLSYGPKTSWPIIMQDSLNCNISQKVNYNNYFKWVWSGMPKVIENNELVIS